MNTQFLTATDFANYNLMKALHITAATQKWRFGGKIELCASNKVSAWLTMKCFEIACPSGSRKTLSDISSTFGLKDFTTKYDQQNEENPYSFFYPYFICFVFSKRIYCLTSHFFKNCKRRYLSG